MKQITLLALNASLTLFVATAQQVNYDDLDLVPTGKKILGYKEMAAKVTLVLDATETEKLIIRTGAGSKKLLVAEGSQVRVEGGLQSYSGAAFSGSPQGMIFGNTIESCARSEAAVFRR